MMGYWSRNVHLVGLQTEGKLRRNARNLGLYPMQVDTINVTFSSVRAVRRRSLPALRPADPVVFCNLVCRPSRRFTDARDQVLFSFEISASDF